MWCTPGHCVCSNADVVAAGQQFQKPGNKSAWHAASELMPQPLILRRTAVLLDLTHPVHSACKTRLNIGPAPLPALPLLHSSLHCHLEDLWSRKATEGDRLADNHLQAIENQAKLRTAVVPRKPHATIKSSMPGPSCCCAKKASRHHKIKHAGPQMSPARVSAGAHTAIPRC
jgi:hypothetical protein